MNSQHDRPASPMGFGITEETSMLIPCWIVQSATTVLDDVLADAETLLAARLERVSLDDLARQAQPNPLFLQLGAHHHG